jgi:hypothetical protein
VWVGYPRRAVPMLDVHGIRVAGGTFPAQIWHDYMTVAKASFCGAFPKPREKPELKPFCARLTVTKHCEPPPGPGDESQSPVQAVPAPAATAPVPAAAAPDTQIAGGPPPQTTVRTAQFRFHAAGPKAMGFECKLDAGPFVLCDSPVEFAQVPPGDHVFAVRAVSQAGERDASPATFQWTVFADLQPNARNQAPPPTANAAPPAPTQAPAAKPKPKPKPKPKQPVIVG